MAKRYWCAECGFKTPWLDGAEGPGRQIEHYARKHPGTSPGGQVETRGRRRTTGRRAERHAGRRAGRHAPLREMGVPDMNEVSTRPGSATAAGVMGIAFGLAAVCGAVYVLLLLGDGNGFGLFGLPVLAFGAGVLRAGAKVLTGVSYAGDRLGQLALVPASLSGIAIGAMVASADWDGDATFAQLAGFIVTFLLAVVVITLCERPATKRYLGED
ncbi:hypothetical protein ACIQWR_08890 [Streptomyces sp. NPDC098789]|uniref:hypothetical protein n=1 Tax=Streptomyces sp. NPDC098789 TaxID=3366098 RepID=UPI00380D39DA